MAHISWIVRVVIIKYNDTLTQIFIAPQPLTLHHSHSWLCKIWIQKQNLLVLCQMIFLDMVDSKLCKRCISLSLASQICLWFMRGIVWKSSSLCSTNNEIFLEFKDIFKMLTLLRSLTSRELISTLSKSENFWEIAILLISTCVLRNTAF